MDDLAESPLSTGDMAEHLPTLDVFHTTSVGVLPLLQ